MKTRSLTLPVLALAATAVLSACTTETTPTAPVAGASGSSSAPTAVTPTGAAAAPEAVVDNDAVLEVEDQTSEGPTVNVKAAAVTAGGWVVVAADGGRNVLGYGEVPAGSTPTVVQVSLAEIITEPTELVARLYDDANGDGIFGAGDKPVTNDDNDNDDAGFPGESATFMFTGADVVNN